MPRQVEWFQRLQDICQLLDSEAAILDRAAIERLFQVSPRQATRILHRMGAESCGGALVIDRQALRDRLRRLETDQTVCFEQERRQRLHATLEAARWESRSRRIVIAAPQEAHLEMAGLPPDILLQRGELNVRFSNSMELLEKLLLLARTISEDWPMFEARLGRGDSLSSR